MRIFKRPEKLIAAIEREQPDIIGLSNYAWNTRASYAFAEAIKRLWPQIIVVMGGPNYPLERDRQIEFMRAQPAADFFICHEGEIAFAKLTRALIEANFNTRKIGTIPSVNYIDAAGSAMIPPREIRIRDLSRIPSPYLGGLMDEFFEDGFMPIIQTKRGCPFTCTFCVEGEDYYTKIAKQTAHKPTAELHYIGAKMAPLVKAGKRADLFIADSNFGMFGDDIETCKMIRECQDCYAWPEYISVATGKNQKERVLEAARTVRGAMRMAGSVQSLDDNVLVNIKRKNVSLQALVEAAREGNAIGANTYSEVILGLPGDSRASFEMTIAKLLELGFNRLAVYTLMLLPGSELDTKTTRERFGFQTKFRIIPKCFGYWMLGSEQISTGEIEEVVVASNTLSFDDYLHCRWLNLMVNVFYNNGLFTPAWELLKSLDIPLIGAVHFLSGLKLPSKLAAIADSFCKETKDELWDSRDALAAFLAKPENVDRLIAGEGGNNVIYKHQSQAFVTAVDEMAVTMRDMLLHLVAQKMGSLSEAQRAFIDELPTFCAAKAMNIFPKDRSKPIIVSSRFDYEAVIQSKTFPILDRVNSRSARRVAFELDDAQQKKIDRLINTYGDTVPGLTRMMGRTNLRGLLRKPRELRA